MRTAVAPPSAAPVVLCDVDDLAEADLDALLTEELLGRPVEADELARSIVRDSALALEAHGLRPRAESLLS
jgi:hypothetical protein